MTVSIHELAIQKVISRRPEKLHTKGINTFLKKLDGELEIGFWDDEDFFDRRPDAWSYVPFDRPGIPGTLNIFEIEDSHMLSIDKMRDYANLWFNFDDLDLGLRLFVYDRYGEQERELCLCEYWFMFLMRDLNLPWEGLASPAVTSVAEKMGIKL